MNQNYDKKNVLPLVRIAVVPLPPMFDFTTDEKGRTVASGTEGIFMDTILKALRYRYELYVPPDHEWGRLLNGNWTGMIGALLNKQADLAWTWLSVNEERHNVVNFSSSYFVDTTTFGVVKPGPLHATYTILYPFDVDVWVAILSVLIIIPIVLFAMKVNFSYCPLFFTVFGSVLKQALRMNTQSAEVRILISSWLLFTTLISSFYSSVLLSFLTMPLENRYIRTFRELSKAAQYGVVESYASKHSAVLPYILHSNEEYLRTLGKVIVKNEWYTDEYMHNKPITTNKNIAIINSEFFLQRKNGLPGSRFLMISDEALLSNNIAVAMRNDFCCTERLNAMITRATEAGLFSHYLQKYSLRGVITNHVVEKKAKSLAIFDISGVLFILVSGLVLSSVTLLVEMLHIRRKNRRM
ncbi:lig_chan-Glu_bd domain-containing protein [Nephila pilipes]|uniref:Lig_chan-Glu_bd domain-containing protein n=1 Tax=Nephila pilipes TaxID=299642 RepID=A0A8X6Q3E3_NEPPI|nr:lig_chan-Glu_bd domain-containing protein [Nephila pilipes]